VEFLCLFYEYYKGATLGVGRFDMDGKTTPKSVMFGMLLDGWLALIFDGYDMRRIPYTVDLLD